MENRGREEGIFGWAIQGANYRGRAEEFSVETWGGDSTSSGKIPQIEIRPLTEENTPWIVRRRGPDWRVSNYTQKPCVAKILY
jgi:hypothetical protein